MSFSLDIVSLGNAAFEDQPELEVARILRNVADKLEQGETDGWCRDINGNPVGSWSIARED